MLAHVYVYYWILMPFEYRKKIDRYNTNNNNYCVILCTLQQYWYRLNIFNGRAGGFAVIVIYLQTDYEHQCRD